MKKILFLLFLCLMISSSVFSKPLSDCYIDQAMGVFTLGMDDAKYLFDLNGQSSETGKVTREVLSALKDKLAIDIEKEVVQIGLYVVPSVEDKANFVAFLGGNFNPKSMLAALKKLMSSKDEEAPKMDAVTINGKKVQALFAKNFRLIFFKKDMLLFCDNRAAALFEKNQLTISKAPAMVEGLMERSQSFLMLNKSVIDMLPKQNIPIQGVETIDILSGYITKDHLYAEAGFKDEEAAKKMMNNVESFKKDFYEKQNKNYEASKANIYTVPLIQIFDEINSLYSAAKNKDIVDHLKISLNGNSIVVAQPYDKDDKLILAVGSVGIIAAAAIPNFKAARSSAREKACYSNMRVLQGAVEMYNMDHATMMSNLDIPTLVKEGYLKGELRGPEPDCDYFSKGDLSKDGCIFCKRHGCVPR
ncbi:MAG: hypothetical protein II961_07160 [Candidatus Riflebacteria bacterium]|nr:hypothetical protein [Candidatus Riflebacteria bacterium]